jgi:hypothetical protein
LNIPEQYHAPIVAFDLEKTNLFKGDIVIAGMMRDKMYVNDEIHKLDYTISRFNHYHEAAHHKYLDPFNAWARALCFKISAAVLTSGGALGLPYSLLYATSKIKNSKISSLLCRFPSITFLTFLTSYIITIPSSLLLRDYAIYPLIVPSVNKNLEKYSQFRERRADLTAGYALKCDECIQARAERHKNGSAIDQELLAKDGYVSWKELEAIAQEHKKNGLVCDYHNTLKNSASSKKRSFWNFWSRD